MSLPAFKLFTLNRASPTNAYGEKPLAYAPTIRLRTGVSAVPQQYLEVRRTLQTLENILADITVPDGFLLFAGQDGDNLFLVSAIFGEENYRKSRAPIEQTDDQTKIVYGRRWLIEPTTTTSEVVQTAMLAVKKAREHELREKFTLAINDGRHTTTPFNCHQDLPLMADNEAGVVMPSESSSLDQTTLNQVLRQVRVDGMSFELVSLIPLGERVLVDLKLTSSPSATTFNDLKHRSVSAMCEVQSTSHFLHQLFNACLAHSDRYVEESVTFNGFARFSHTVSPQAVAEFSYTTRNVKISDERFNSEFSDMSYRVDSSKAPFINDGALGQHQREVLGGFVQLDGYLPKEPKA